MSTTRSDLIPKLFLGGTVALVVSRPLIGDSDPARQTITLGAGPLTHQLLTLLFFFAWGIWRTKSRLPVHSGGAIVLLMLLVLGAMTASTLLTSVYPHASWCLVWETVSLTAMVWIVRQWRDTPGASFALLSVLIALAASVSAQAIYQRLAGPLEWPDLEIPKVKSQDLLVGDFAGRIPVAQLPEATGIARGCFDGSETLFLFLLPLLPVVLYLGHVGWWRQKTPRSRGRILIVLLIGVAYVITDVEFFSKPVGPRRLPKSVPSFPADFLGIGPGTLTREGRIHQPSFGSPLDDLVLILGLGAPLILLGWVFLGGRLCAASRSDVAVVEDSESLRNTLFAGGMAGSLLGFLLGTGNVPAEAPPNVVLNLGVIAGVRSFVFFACLALLQGTPLSRKWLLRLSGVGTALVLSHSAWTNRLELTTVLHPFLVFVAVALNLCDGERSEASAPVWKPLVVALGGMALVAAQLIQSFQPGLTTTTSVREAREASRHLPELTRDVEVASGARRFQAMQKAEGYLRAQILNPLRRACRIDSTNSILLLETAFWLRLEWNYCRNLGEDKRAADVTREMLALLEAAVQLDPRNPVAFDEQLQTLLFVFEESKTLRDERSKLIERNLSRHYSFANRVKYLETLLRLYEKRIAKQTDEERQFIRDLLEEQALAVFRLDNRHQEFTKEEREEWVRKLQIAVLDPKPELKGYLNRN